MFAYAIKLEPDDNGALLVTSPDLPGVVTFGEDREDAIRHAQDAIEEWLHRSRLEQLEAAFRALGRQLDVVVSEAA
ncbi:MAG TPA: type II toxin-antitoxin system HicB family antitoxin [Beijerinckiaceae bacterium]|jgi:predicted RNase H-like HicB family nuclease|nr:type II toxin-antitoxin system HicB family antitoxin [Beijerinckiaceae bacterium]